MVWIRSRTIYEEQTWEAYSGSGWELIAEGIKALCLKDSLLF